MSPRIRHVVLEVRHQPHDVVPRDQLRVRELLRVERIHPPQVAGPHVDLAG